MKNRTNNQLIISNQIGAIFEICINRPDKLNALTDKMYGSLIESLTRAENDPAIKVILLRSSGAHFSAGNDLADFLEIEFNFDSNVVQFLVTLAKLKKPLIAAVNGVAIGIGTTMLLHCDIVFAAKNTKFSMPFIKLGLTPEGGASKLLAQRCGSLKANDWLLTGRNILTDEALENGLINQICENHESTWQTSIEIAKKLAKSSNETLKETKSLLKSDQIPEVIELIKKEAVLFAQKLHSDETQSNIKAFLTS